MSLLSPIKLSPAHPTQFLAEVSNHVGAKGKLVLYLMSDQLNAGDISVAHHCSRLELLVVCRHHRTRPSPDMADLDANALEDLAFLLDADTFRELGLIVGACICLSSTLRRTLSSILLRFYRIA